MTLRLTSAPTTNVTIPLSSSDTTEGTVSPASLTFTPANALIPQTITVTGVNDGEVDGNVAYSIVTGAAVSGDFNYNGLNPADVAVTNQDDDPIRVTNISVNGGQSQRSMLKGITVTFSQVVTPGANAFTVQRTDGFTAGLIVTPTVVGNHSVVFLTFTGPGVAAGSLPDGKYTLTVRGAGLTDPYGQQVDANGDGTPGGDYVSPPDTAAGGPGQLRLFRLFGDSDGNGLVDLTDLSALRTSFNAAAGDPGFSPVFDYDGNGVVDLDDLQQFRSRFNVNLFP